MDFFLLIVATFRILGHKREFKVVDWKKNTLRSNFTGKTFVYCFSTCHTTNEVWQSTNAHITSLFCTKKHHSGNEWYTYSTQQRVYTAREKRKFMFAYFIVFFFILVFFCSHWNEPKHFFRTDFDSCSITNATIHVVERILYAYNGNDRDCIHTYTACERKATATVFCIAPVANIGTQTKVIRDGVQKSLCIARCQHSVERSHQVQTHTKRDTNRDTVPSSYISSWKF